MKAVITTLTDTTGRIQARDWPDDVDGVDLPGIYAWWVNRAGAKQLTGGLGHKVKPGLLYVGQAGATASSGEAGSATLRSRIAGNHLGGRVGTSTLRRSITVALAGRPPLNVVAELKLDNDSEDRLSDWMRAHLAIAVHSEPDRDTLCSLEHAVLKSLDPPFNLDGMPRTKLRRELTARRSQLKLGRGPITRPPVPVVRRWWSTRANRAARA